MRRGPKGKPAKVKLLEGNPGNRPVPTDYVKPEGDLIRPDHVTGYAADVWKRVVAAMPEGVYMATDFGVLSAFCVACETHRTATFRLIIQDHVIMEERVGGGEIMKRNPWSAIQADAARQIMTLGATLGLDPLSRERVRAPTTGAVDKFAGLVGIDGGKN